MNEARDLAAHVRVLEDRLREQQHTIKALRLALANAQSSHPLLRGTRDRLTSDSQSP